MRHQQGSLLLPLVAPPFHPFIPGDVKAAEAALPVVENSNTNGPCLIIPPFLLSLSMHAISLSLSLTHSHHSFSLSHISPLVFFSPSDFVFGGGGNIH